MVGFPARSGAADRDLGAVEVAEAGDAGAVHVGRWAGEDDALRLRLGVEAVEVVGAEAELDGACRILGGCRMERELRRAGVEFAPERRLEAECEPQSVAVESDGGVHVADELDRIVEAHGFLPLMTWRSAGDGARGPKCGPRRATIGASRGSSCRARRDRLGRAR